MEFTLTPQVIDKIGFAMEDQDQEFCIDAVTGELVPAEEAEAASDPDRYVPIPAWGPAEGFHLMENFITTLRNPLYRDMLAEALAAGRGVFRAFKDTLKKSREIEKLWFLYKERRFKGIIVAWYNMNREARGLSKMKPEPEETEELLASDFTVEWGERGHREGILELDRDAFLEMFPTDRGPSVEARYREKRSGLPAPGEEPSAILAAEAPTGELAGFVWGLVEGDTVRLIQFAVIREYRGIGLGAVLLRRFVLDLGRRGAKLLTMEVAGRSLRYSDFFESIGFKPTFQVLEVDLSQLSF
jgi:ribosomal protein S18 acetylase RimI-like enzyme